MRRCVLATLAALVLPVAAAQADAAWTGASTSSAWSDPGNWSDATPPTASTGTLSFPALGTCGTCYTSRNDLGSISADSLILGNDTNQYVISGNGFTVGSGGINDTPGHGAGDVIKAPIALSGSQTWVVGSSANGYNSLTFQTPITGGSAVTTSTPNGDLFVDTDMEVGPVTSSGPGGLHIGGAPGLNEPGSVNGTDGQPVTITGGALVANPDSTAGPLTITGGTLLLGTDKFNTGATTLHVNGSVALGSASTTQTFVNNNGSSAGTDFSQLSASGNIALGGNLVLGQGKLANGTGQCVALTAGAVATLVKANGTLSGTFANAPDGATLTMTGSISCESAPPKLQIHYTSDSVTATVLGDTATTLASPSPSPATTNQSVTLSATVTSSGSSRATPDGTVAFLANGSTIPGCAGQPLTTSGSSGTATCQVAFPASGSPESLSAAFTPAGGSGQGPSISAAQTLTVSPAATTAALQPSDTNPAAGTSVTYTATVTPGTAGATTPTGTIAFLDGASPISGCSAQPLTPGSSSSTATCKVTYATASSHTVAARYAGDANFTGSTSPTATVSVHTSATPSGDNGNGSGSGNGSTGSNPSAGSGLSPRGAADLVLSRVAQSRTRWRERRGGSAPRVRSVALGTRFTFSVSRAARVTFTFIQMLPGRRVGRRCLAPSRATSRDRACTRARTRGRLTRSVGSGTHHVDFDGRLGRVDLPPGSYSVAVTATATSRVRSRTRTLHFTIVG